MTPAEGTVLVTGGAGFVGSELVSQLAASGRNVRVLDNLSTGSRENLSGIDHGRVELIEGDLGESSRLPSLFDSVSLVYHLACLGVRHSIHSPEQNHHVNATGTLKLLEAARRAGVRRFVHVSSCEVYGAAQSVPMTESHPTEPATVYGAAKLAGESLARAYHTTYGLSTVIVRPFNTYGPRCHHEGDSGEVIPRFFLRARTGRPLVIFGDGAQARDFTYVSDTARGILLAGESADAVGRTINLGSGKAVSISELAARVARAAGCGEPRLVHDASRPGDVFLSIADTRLAEKLLGFRPAVSMDEGLARLAAWYAGCGRTPESMMLASEVVRNWEPVGQADSLPPSAPRKFQARQAIGLPHKATT